MFTELHPFFTEENRILATRFLQGLMLLGLVAVLIGYVKEKGDK